MLVDFRGEKPHGCFCLGSKALMTKRITLESQLARLGEIERAALTPELRDELNAALDGATNIVTARAAQVMASSGQADFVPRLVAAFLHLLGQPAAADKNCRAKEAILLALDALGSYQEEAPLRGIRYMQMEPVYGGRTDTAINLRAVCATALARMHYREAHFELTRLLVDPAAPPRIAAVQALAFLGDERSELLLRLKVLSGDREPEVLGACFNGLLALAPERSLPFTAEFLSAEQPGLAEQAAIAIGESHLDGAFAYLRACWEARTDFTFRKTLLLAIALTRCDEAFDFLLAVIRDEGRSSALLALEVLNLFAPDDKRRARIGEAVHASGDVKVRETFTG